jgi:hypothetical protein
MAIEVACGCGKRFRVPEEYEGRKVKCAACKSAIRVSEASVLTAPMPLTPAASPAQLQVGEPSVFLPLSKPSPLSKTRGSMAATVACRLDSDRRLCTGVSRRARDALRQSERAGRNVDPRISLGAGALVCVGRCGRRPDHEAQANLWPEPGPNDLKWKQRIMDLVESGRVVTCANGLRVQQVSGEARIFSCRVLLLDGAFEGRAVWVESHFLREPLAAEIHPTPTERQAEFKAALEALADHR